MGREIKRVTLNFDWPLEKVWKGFINPHHLPDKCQECEETGYAPEARFLYHAWYHGSAQDLWGAFYGDNIIATWSRPKLKRAGWSDEVCDNIERARKFGFTTLTHWSDKLTVEDVQALVDNNRLYDFTHTWSKKDGWQPKNPPCIPTPDEVNAWSGIGIGHDAINCHVCIEARCKRLGLEITCPICKGHGEVWASDADRVKYENWEPTQPPPGDGWQIWETVSEGSPVSPVFATPEELAKWYTENGDRAYGKLTYGQALAFVKAGWAPSFMGTDKGLISGVEACSTKE